MKYPLIQKYMSELKIEQGYSNGDILSKEVTHYIKASDLEAILAKGVEVYGDDDIKLGFATSRNYEFSHSGLLIGYKPIESQEPVNIKELLEAIYGVRKGQGYDYLEKIAKRIKKNGVRND